MNLKLFLVVLVFSAIVSGCVSKPQEGPSTTVLSATTTTLVPAGVGEGATGDEIPDVAEVSEEEVIQEPDLEINDTVDLGSLL